LPTPAACTLEFEKDVSELKARLEGQFVFNNTPRVLSAARRFGSVPSRRSRATGKKVRFEVAVGPEGAPNITPIEEAPSADAGPAPAADSRADLDRAFAAARERGWVQVAAIMSSPEMLTADDFAARLGTTRATVNTWRQKHQVLDLEGAKKGFRFPAWQLGDDGKPFAVLPELFERLGDTPWAVYRFLIQHHPEHDDLTAQEALRRGRDKEVLEAAENAGRTFD
jgi:hypothetical protein